VNKGYFSKNVLRQVGCYLTEYFAIDQWEAIPDPKYGRMSKIDQAGWDDRYFTVCRMMQFFPVLKVIKAKSIIAADMFPNNYFDLVYIDTSHFYEDTLADILAWTHKVRPGGYIGGHDYETPRPEHQGVKKAVNELFLFSKIMTREDGVWLVRL